MSASGSTHPEVNAGGKARGDHLGSIAHVAELRVLDGQYKSNKSFQTLILQHDCHTFSGHYVYYQLQSVIFYFEAKWLNEDALTWRKCIMNRYFCIWYS